MILSPDRYSPETLRRYERRIADLADECVRLGVTRTEDLTQQQRFQWAAALVPDPMEWLETASMDQLSDAILDIWDGKRTRPERLMQIVLWLGDEVAEQQEHQIQRHLNEAVAAVEELINNGGRHESLG